MELPPKYCSGSKEECIDLNFSMKYGEEEYEIFELPMNFEVPKDPNIYNLKDSKRAESGTYHQCTLHTKDESFDLYKYDTSNLYLFLDKNIEDTDLCMLNNINILKMCRYYIAFTPLNMQYKEALSVLHKKYTYSIQKGRNNLGISWDMLLHTIQLSQKELPLGLEEVNAFVVLENHIPYYYILDDYLEIEIILEILKLIKNEIILPYFVTLDELNIRSDYIKMLPDGAIIAAIRSIADAKYREESGIQSKTGTYTINLHRVKRALGKSIFISKRSLILSEYEETLNNLLNLVLSQGLLGELEEEEDKLDIGQNNLFPGYSQTRLHYINGFAFLIPSSIHGQQPTIEYIGEYDLSFDPKIRFKELIELKNHWTKHELKYLFEPCLPSDMTLDKFLAKFGKQIIKPNPFGGTAKSCFFGKKF